FPAGIQPLDEMREGVEDTEEPDDDQAVTDANPTVREVLPEGARGFGQADQEERDALHQVGDGMLDERGDRACDLIPAIVHVATPAGRRRGPSPSQGPDVGGGPGHASEQAGSSASHEHWISILFALLLNARRSSVFESTLGGSQGLWRLGRSPGWSACRCRTTPTCHRGASPGGSAPGTPGDRPGRSRWSRARELQPRVIRRGADEPE